MRKRIVTLLLAVAMVFAMLPTAFAAEPAEGLANFKKVNTYIEGQFTDVKPGQWYTPNIEASYEMGLVLGKGDGSFGVNDPVTLATAVTLAARIHSIYHTGSANFKQGNPWYQVYVDYAVANGIIGAGEYSNFNANATRAQFSKILAASVPESALKAINKIAKGEVHDLPNNTEYAEAAYLLYNAGIITGTDAYGTFKADAEIMRSEAVTIVTRVVDTTLRKTFTLKVHPAEQPRHVYIVDMGESYRDMEQSELAIGQLSQLIANMIPDHARSGIVWTSSDPSVVSVSEYGQIIAHRQGTVTITAETFNNLKATLTVNVPNGPAELQYVRTSDGTGYEIVGCDSGAYTVHIPAEYNGLPVLSIRAGAFKECLNLRFFTVDEAQSVFYEEGGVVFTDVPEKTLVVFPAAYDAESYYYVPEGTVAIAPYAFAGIGGTHLSLRHTPELITLTIPEGVRTLGDCAFALAQSQIRVFVPDSLTEIGKSLMQSQRMNIPFYGNKGTAIYKYAEKNNIPFGVILESKPVEQTVLIQVPEHESGANLLPVDEENVVVFDKVRSAASYMPERGGLYQSYDLTDYQTDFDGEVRMMLASQWDMLMPDENGRKTSAFIEQTGLYGMGYTDGDAILRAYDYYGHLIAVQEIGGNFSFCFPGAYNLGVEGGKNTTVGVLPVEPVYLSSSGVYPIQTEHWYEMYDGNRFQMFVLQFPGGSITTKFQSQHLNLVRSVRYDLDEDIEGFRIVQVETKDASRIEEMNAVSLAFVGMGCVLDNEELYCVIAEEFEGYDTFAKTASDTLSAVKKAMVGNYFPASHPIPRITMIVNGSYPGVLRTTVHLDENAIETPLTMTHETVHAVDGCIEQVVKVAPSAWMEGRAEYISRKACDLLGADYWEREDTFDWTFLSDEDKADFFRYYYFSANRYTAYDVGYHFLRYLNKTYGEDISAKIMANMAALSAWDSVQRSEANAALFKQCVEDATEVGVFQNFVRDVIEK